MGTYSGADLFVDVLEEYGTKHLFGNPGTTEVPIINSLEDSSIEYILSLHEDIAVGAAAGYARTLTYRSNNNSPTIPVGVANIHVAPGLAHGLGNIYNAYRGGVPLVVTAGDHRTDIQHQDPALGGNLVRMADPYTKWSAEVSDVSALSSMLRRAFRVAQTPPTGPVFLSLPVDVMLAETDDSPKRLGEIPTAGRGERESLKNAAEIISTAEEVKLILGDEICRSGDDSITATIDFAEVVGAHVHGEILTAEINFPTDHDQWVSYLPANADSAKEIVDTDVLILAGCSSNTPLNGAEKGFIPEKTTCIHISTDPWQLGKNEPADAAIIGDPGEIFEELVPLVRNLINEEKRHNRLARLKKIQASNKTQIKKESERSLMSKEALTDTIVETAPDAFIVDESLTSKYIMFSRAKLQPQEWLGNKGGGLGYGLPASIGAALAESIQKNPRDVIGFIGDGSYLYYPQSIYTATRYDIDLTVVIPDNRNYRILKDNTLAMMGGSEDDYEFIGMDFDPHVDIPMSAQSHGAEAKLIESESELKRSLEEAIGTSSPVVLDVLVHD